MTFPFTINLDPNRFFFEVQDIPIVLLEARTDQSGISLGLIRINYEDALERAIESGDVTLRNPISYEEHTFPLGNARKEAVITLNDFKRFAASLQIQVEVSQSTTANEADSKANSGKPPPRQRFQEQEILRVIRELKHDPKKLPKDVSGKEGVKAEVRSMLDFSPRVFDKAWERLSSMKEICKLK